MRTRDLATVAFAASLFGTGCGYTCEEALNCGPLVLEGGGGVGGQGSGGGGTGGMTVASTRWAVRYGDMATQHPLAMAATATGASFVVGELGGALSLDTAAAVSAGAEDGFVLRLDEAGKGVWARAIGTANGDTLTAVTPAQDGGAIVAGRFLGTAQLGAGITATSDAQDALVVRLDATGATLWATALGGAGDQEARAVALSADGSAVGVVGVSTGGASMGGTDIYLAWLDAGTGALLNDRFVGGLEDDAGTAAAFVGGTLVVAGHFRAAVDFGTGSQVAGGSDDVFVMGIPSSSLTPSWVKRFGDGESQVANALAGSPSGFVLGGTMGGTVDFGGGSLTAIADDGFVVAFDAAGAHRWSRRVTGPGRVEVLAVGLGGSGGVRLGGRYEGASVELDGRTLLASNAADGFAAALDDDGGLQLLVALGGSGTQEATGVGAGQNGSLLAAGPFADTLVVGESMLIAEGGLDGYAVAIEP
ncbi:MAG: hypothetical protein R3B72_49480 [Polyangiaceae bacterium]